MSETTANGAGRHDSVSGWSSERMRRRAVFAVVLLGLAWFKLPFTEAQFQPRVDGGYYTDIAQHVRDGSGLVTDVSLYHKAYPHFPHPTAVYPLWPLLYGHVAKAFDVFDVGRWLPALLYFVSLGLAYVWANRLFPRATFPRTLPTFDAGHVLSLVIGLHLQYFVATSHPYTEALSMVTLFVALWRVDGLWLNPSLARGVEAGVWGGLLVLVRSQLLLATMALLLTLAWGSVASERRRKFALAFGGAFVAFALVVGVQLARIRGFVHDAGFDSLVRFHLARASAAMTPVHMMVETTGLFEYLADRASGFVVAFRFAGHEAYARCFHVFQYGIFAALLVVGLDLGQKGPSAALNDLRRRAQSPEGLRWMFIGLFAVGAFLSIHTFHKQYFLEWNFASRQGVWCAFLFFLALGFLLGHERRAARVAATAIVAVSLYLGVARLHHETRRATALAEMKPSGYVYGSPLTQWLTTERARRGSLTVALSAQEPARMAPYTPGVGYHWIYEHTTIDDLEYLVRELGVDYVITARDTQGSDFARSEARLETLLRPTESVGRFIVSTPR